MPSSSPLYRRRRRRASTREGLHTEDGDGGVQELGRGTGAIVVGVGSQVGTAERRSVGHDAWVVVADAQQVDGDPEVVVRHPGVDERQGASPDELRQFGRSHRLRVRSDDRGDQTLAAGSA